MKTVLLMDDSATSLLATTRVLEEAGYRVVSPKRFIDLPKLIDKEKPMAIVLDLEMPALGGGQIASMVNGYAPELPIVFYSGRDPASAEPLTRQFSAPFVAKQAASGELVRAIELSSRAKRVA